MVCHSYLSRFYSYVTRVYLLVSVCRWYVTRISLVCIRISLVCICLCPYVGGMSLVSLSFLFACHSFVSVYHSYVSACAVCRWYVTRMSLVCIFRMYQHVPYMSLVCYPSMLIIVEWNPVNTDTKGAFQIALII